MLISQLAWFWCELHLFVSQSQCMLLKRVHYSKDVGDAGVDLGIFVTSSTLEPKYV